ncbi:MAG: thiamine-phosphate kinase [Planctomycetota bacterium]|nr:thiamine-phosphate kinase [Planctomycetota bacterium]
MQERELTGRLRSFFGRQPGLVVPIGDDAAVVRPTGGDVALCCDPVISGVHFEASAPLRLVGRKAVNRNLSDLAAMGAKPRWLLCSVVLPRSMSSADLWELLRGVRGASAAASAAVIGGDVAVSDGPLSVHISAFGCAPKQPLRRNLLQVGDTLHVTGSVGGAIDGHHLRFRPALREGAWLADQDAVRAAMDVSDGLAIDLETMLQASGGLGALLDAPAIPIRAAARRLAGGDRAAALRRALHDGEDYCLLFGVRRGGRLDHGGPLTARARRPIGRVVAEPGITLRAGGRMWRVAVDGYQHEVGR